MRVIGTLRIFDRAAREQLDDALAFVPDEHRDDPLIVAKAVEVVAPAGTATIEDVVTEPARFAGQTVTVSGEVDDVLGRGLVTVEDDEGLLGVLRGELLVIDAGDRPVELTGDEVLVVTGTVRMLAASDLDLIDRPDLKTDPQQILSEFEGHPVLVADRVVVVGME